MYSNMYSHKIFFFSVCRYYVSRLVRHDPLLRVIRYEEFESMYGYHQSTSTWIKERLKDKTCTDIGSIYPEGKVLIFAPSKNGT